MSRWPSWPHTTRKSRPPLVEPGSAAFVYLEAEDTLGLYADLLGCPNQQARGQVRDRNTLESADSRLRNYALYQDADLALQAAVLAHAIAEGRP